MSYLSVLADLATIITGVIAAYGYGSYRLDRHKRMIAVERVLARKTAQNDNSLLVSQLAAELKLTEDQVVEAAYYSKKIRGTGGQSGNDRRLKFVPNSN